MKPMEPVPPGWPDNLTQAPPPPPAPAPSVPEPEYEPKHLKQDEPAKETVVMPPIEPPPTEPVPIPEPLPSTEPVPIPEPPPQPPQPANGYGTTVDVNDALYHWVRHMGMALDELRVEATKRYHRSVAIALTYFVVTIVAIIILLVNKASS